MGWPVEDGSVVPEVFDVSNNDKPRLLLRSKEWEREDLLELKYVSKYGFRFFQFLKFLVWFHYWNRIKSHQIDCHWILVSNLLLYILINIMLYAYVQTITFCFRTQKNMNNQKNINIINNLICSFVIQEWTHCFKNNLNNKYYWEKIIYSRYNLSTLQYCLCTKDI